MALSPEVLRNSSTALLANAWELREAATEARQRGAACRDIAQAAREAGANWRDYAEAARKRQDVRPRIASNTEGVGQRAMPSHRVEVKALFAAPRQYGWKISRQKGTSPILHSPVGYASEADAWSAGGEALAQLLRVERRRR